MDNGYSFLNPRESCLLVIDPQERLMQAIYAVEKVIKNTVLMITCAKILNIPIIATTQYKKGLGPFVKEIKELLDDVVTVDKVEFNAFSNEEVLAKIKGLEAQIHNLFIVGVEAHICIYQTAIGAALKGFKPFVIADAISSREAKNAELAINRLQFLKIDVISTEMAIYELLKMAGTEEFKAMLPYLK